MDRLPIEEAIPALRERLATGRSVLLTAQPGAGKTTRVPLALLDEPWLTGQKLIMLEPRRLAARAAATYMATSLGEPVGRTVGFRIRHESKVSAATRIEVVTEGILTRLLQHDPSLAGYGLVFFDEFHERSLQADLGLAFARESQRLFREDLRLLVMSATIDCAAVTGLLSDAATISCEGRLFPVATQYLDQPVEGHVEPAVVRSIRTALAKESGSLLVFLPGMAEILRVERQLREAQLGPDVMIAPLHGELPQAAPLAVSDVLRSIGWSQEPPEARGAVRDRWESLNALMQLAEAAVPGTTLKQFVDELFERQAGQHEPVLSAVTLATLHSAKGLEWESVHLVGLSEGLLPISYAKDAAAVEEERRLLYVGVTRARRRLGLSWSASPAPGRSAQRQPSRFLSAL